jgi:hypothetical protein
LYHRGKSLQKIKSFYKGGKKWWILMMISYKKKVRLV